jgi:hypothetical protein
MARASDPVARELVLFPGKLLYAAIASARAKDSRAR